MHCWVMCIQVELIELLCQFKIRLSVLNAALPLSLPGPRSCLREQNISAILQGSQAVKCFEREAHFQYNLPWSQRFFRQILHTQILKKTKRGKQLDFHQDHFLNESDGKIIQAQQCKLSQRDLQYLGPRQQGKSPATWNLKCI